MLPFLIFLVLDFGGNALIYGLMGATYSVFQLIGAPILGKWSDQYGRRKILLLSQAGTLLSWLIFLTALYLPIETLLKVESGALGTFSLTIPLIVLFIARSLDGITGGNISVAQAYLSDITDDENKNENFGKMAISANLGFIIGPAFAGLIGATAMGEALPVLAAIIISIIAMLLIVFKLPESKPCLVEENISKGSVQKIFGQEHKDCYNIEGTNKISFSEIRSIKNIPFVLLIYFLIFLGFNLFYITFPVYAVKTMNWELTDTGAYFAVLGFLMAFFQGPVLKKASYKWSEIKLIVTGSFILSLSFLLYSSTNTVIIYLAALFLAAGNGLMWPSVLSILSKTAGDKYQGTVQGIAGSIGSIASILGLVLGGLFYNEFGAGIFVFSAVIIFSVFIMSLRLIKIKVG